MKVLHLYRSARTFFSCLAKGCDVTQFAVALSHTSWFNTHESDTFLIRALIHDAQLWWGKGSPTQMRTLLLSRQGLSLTYTNSLLQISIYTILREAWQPHVRLRCCHHPVVFVLTTKVYRLRRVCGMVSHGRCCIFPVFPRENIYVTVLFVYTLYTFIRKSADSVCEAPDTCRM